MGKYVSRMGVPRTDLDLLLADLERRVRALGLGRRALATVLGLPSTRYLDDAFSASWNPKLRTLLAIATGLAHYELHGRPIVPPRPRRRRYARPAATAL